MNNTDLQTGVVGELGTKAPAVVATMVNITLEGLQTVNGVLVQENDIVLVNGQTDKKQNGVYIVSTGEWQRAVWFDDELDAVNGTLIMATGGTIKPNTLWQTFCADKPIVFGTSEIEFRFFATSSSTPGGGTYLLSGNNLSDVDDAAQSRENLGLEIGVDVQAQNTFLQQISDLNPSLDDLMVFNPADTISLINKSTLVNTATTSTKGTVYIPNLIQVDLNAGVPATRIDFAAGNFINSFKNGEYYSPTPMTKYVNAAWEAGTNKGGLFSGSMLAFTTYFCFVIHDPINNLYDYGFSTDPLAADRPAAYTIYKRLKAHRTDGSANLLQGSTKYFPDGSYIFQYLNNQPTALTTSNTTTQNINVASPAGIQCLGFFKGYTRITGIPGATTFHYVKFFSSLEFDDAVGAANSNITAVRNAGTFESSGNASFSILLDIDSIVKVKSNDANTNQTELSMTGYLDFCNQ